MLDSSLHTVATKLLMFAVCCNVVAVVAGCSSRPYTSFDAFVDAEDLVCDDRFEEAKEKLNEAIELAPDDSAAYLLLAELLASCPIDRFRDGAAANELAKIVEQSLSHEQWRLNAVMACIQAELGKYDLAMIRQKRALVACPKKLQDSMNFRLETFSRRSPYRGERGYLAVCER